MRRPEFSFDHESKKHFIRDCLEKAARRRVSLVITDNSTTMLSMRDAGRSVMLRLHRIFLEAGMDVLNELSDYITGRKSRTPLIRNFINSNTHRLKEKPPRRINIRTQGRYHDLLDIYRSVNDTYFGGRVSASITWGTRTPRRSARRMTLGSYTTRGGLIRISPVLDSRRVPRYFLEYIVYHEMLHADMGIGGGKGRRIIHSKEFRRRERLFKHYDRAVAWEKKWR